MHFMIKKDKLGSLLHNGIATNFVIFNTKPNFDTIFGYFQNLDIRITNEKSLGQVV